MQRVLLGIALLASFVFAGDDAANTALAAPKPRDLNTYHLFTPPGTKDAWLSRAADLRKQVLASAGLLPMPAKTPLNAKITATLERPDFIVENVVIETWPGIFMCGNIYRPASGTGPFPAIVNPHGHWKAGRMTMEEDVPPASEEQKPAPGKANLVAIGVNLAREGFVCFAYDMIGYGDTLQMPHKGSIDGLENWSWSASLLGLQLWNSIRAVDYLESLSYVDRARIGATGASGGGSQTFLLAAVDERIACSVPVNMVSAHMQGGCLCENGPGLRVGTDNAEFAAVFAPRPQLLVSCTGDWTRHNRVEEGPRIQRVYELFGAADRLEVVRFHYEHNYNRESRAAMVNFFRRWLQNKMERAPEEKPFELKAEDLKVWNAQHPAPSPTLALDVPAFTQSWICAAQTQFVSQAPRDAAAFDTFRGTYGAALRQALHVEEPLFDEDARRQRIAARAEHGVLLVVVAGEDAERRATLERELLERGVAVYTKEMPPIKTSAELLQKDFFSGYNRTPLSERVQDIVDAAATVQRMPGLKRLSLAGLGQAGPWTLLAAACGAGNGRVAVDLDALPAGNVMTPEWYAPGLLRAGSWQSAAILLAPRGVLLTKPAPECLLDPVKHAASGLHGTVKVEDTMNPKNAANFLAKK